jgi:hypothetical protein
MPARSGPMPCSVTAESFAGDIAGGVLGIEGRVSFAALGRNATLSVAAARSVPLVQATARTRSAAGVIRRWMIIDCSFEGRVVTQSRAAGRAVVEAPALAGVEAAF